MDLPEAVVGNSSEVRQKEWANKANAEKITGQIVQIHPKKVDVCLRVWFLKQSSEDLGA